jgi:hypothetical protein
MTLLRRLSAALLLAPLSLLPLGCAEEEAPGRGPAVADGVLWEEAEAATAEDVAAVDVAALDPFAAAPARAAVSGGASARESRPPEETPEPAGGPTADLPEVAPRELSAKRLAYLQEAASQARRLEELIRRLDANRLGSAALAASALAANGREAWKGQAAAWVSAALDRCAGDWSDLDCEIGLLSLQRVALQFAGGLPPELQRRLRREAAAAAPPPPPEQVRDPWAFQRTENQQAVVMARSLAAHALAGTAGSPPARAWADHAAAFLLAHDRDGWYEADSPGYIATSITALLHLLDHAPDARVRDLAGRQLQLRFAAWAENQVGGTPAGPRSRTYTHWAQGNRNTPWPAWLHYATGTGEAADFALGDWPDIAASSYEFPAPVVELLRTARSGEPYEVRTRRRILMQRRRDLDAATYSWVTPDYVLGTAPAVDGLSLAVSGGQEIQATLFPEGERFAPLYLWSRVNEPRGRRWRSRARQEQAAGWRHLAVASMGMPAEPGHAWLSPPWSRPQPPGGGEGGERDGGGDVLVARYGGVYVALVTEGGWEVEPAPRRFPDYYGDAASKGSWVAVPRRQPAAIGLEVGRAAEVGSWEAWREKARGLRLTAARGEAEAGADGASAGEERAARDGETGGRRARRAAAAPEAITFRSSDGRSFVFRPGVSATLDGDSLSPAAWPLHASPFLAKEPAGGWLFEGGGVRYRFTPLERPPARDAPPPGSAPASAPAPPRSPGRD